MDSIVKGKKGVRSVGVKREYSGSSGVAFYTLTAEEREHLERGELHKIPAAAERGLEYPLPEARASAMKVVGAWNGKAKKPKWDIKRKDMEKYLDAGLTYTQISKITGIPRGSVSSVIAKFQLSHRGA